MVLGCFLFHVSVYVYLPVLSLHACNVCLPTCVYLSVSVLLFPDCRPNYLCSLFLILPAYIQMRLSEKSVCLCVLDYRYCFVCEPYQIHQLVIRA